MISTVGAIILTIHSISLMHIELNRPVPLYVKLIMNRFEKRLYKSSKYKKCNNSETGVNNEVTLSRDKPDDLTSKLIAETFDRLYFYIYTIYFATLHIWLLVIGLINSYNI